MHESCTPIIHGYESTRSEMVFKEPMMKEHWHLKSVCIMDLIT